jgi:hypothetical protein
VTEQLIAGLEWERAALDPRALHDFLLRLAGRVPDDELATMRTCLADGEGGEVAWMLESIVAARRVPLLSGEADLVRELFDAHRIPADGIERIGYLPPVPYRFTGEGAQDTRDAVVVEAGDRVGGLVALWRAFRHTGGNAGQRVYLGEADPDADVAELTAEAQHALAEAGEDPPRVEIFSEGAELAPYHDAALMAATLVWARTDAPVRLARAFDGADPDGGPFFHPDHPRLDGPDGERVLAYLRGGELVLNTPGAMEDVLDQGREAVVPAGFRSDGHWVWPDTVAYYLKRHRLAPDPELTAYVLGAPSPGPLSRLGRHRALETLFAPTGVEPMWQAG